MKLGNTLTPNDDLKLERLKNIATIFSAVAIPIVLTIAGYFIQRQISDAGLKKDYVAIAAGILKENPANQEPDLRAWALAVLEVNSPVPFSKKAREGLLTGIPVVVPGPAWFGPPEDCRTPPGKRTVLEEYIKLGKDQASGKLNDEQLRQRINRFLDLVRDQEKDVLITRLRLKCMQQWANNSEQSDIKYRAAIGAPSSKSIMEQISKENESSASSVGASKLEHKGSE